MGGSRGRQLTEEVTAQRLGVTLVDPSDLGRPWTVRDVAGALGARSEWFRSARRALGAARAEEERQRKACFDAVLARRCVFEYPPGNAAASDFAREFAKVTKTGDAA